MRDGRTALPGLIRIQPAPNAFIKGISKGRAEEAANGRRSGKGVTHHIHQGWPNIFDIGKYHREARYEIQNGHRRHDFFRHLNNPFNAA